MKGEAGLLQTWTCSIAVATSWARLAGRSDPVEGTASPGLDLVVDAQSGPLAWGVPAHAVHLSEIRGDLCGLIWLRDGEVHEVDVLVTWVNVLYLDAGRDHQL